MRTLSASDIVLKVLGLLLLVAALLKGHELLTVPVANKDLWSWRPFLIFQVEFELALGIWLLSGVFKRLAWLASLTCVGLFCCVTLYKGLTGAASCGCFGSIHINSWVTLLAVDLPAAVALSLFRPAHCLTSLRAFLRRQESIHRVVQEFFEPMASLSRFAATGTLGLAVLGVAGPILALNKPAVVTSTYEVLEPETWVGKELPILKYIDIGDQLRSGTWLLLFYHHDCPDCREAVSRYQRMARDLSGAKDFLRMAFVEIPPYGPGRLGEDSGAYAVGRLTDVKEWFVTTPVAVLLEMGKVDAAWEHQAPDWNAILTRMAESGRKVVKLVDFHDMIRGAPTLCFHRATQETVTSMCAEEITSVVASMVVRGHS